MILLINHWWINLRKCVLFTQSVLALGPDSSTLRKETTLHFAKMCPTLKNYDGNWGLASSPYFFPFGRNNSSLISRTYQGELTIHLWYWWTPPCTHKLSARPSRWPNGIRRRTRHFAWTRSWPVQPAVRALRDFDEKRGSKHLKKCLLVKANVKHNQTASVTWITRNQKANGNRD